MNNIGKLENQEIERQNKEKYKKLTVSFSIFVGTTAITSLLLLFQPLTLLKGILFLAVSILISRLVFNFVLNDYDNYRSKHRKKS